MQNFSHLAPKLREEYEVTDGPTGTRKDNIFFPADPLYMPAKLEPY